METIRKRFSAELTVSEGERAVVARISTISLDRDGEVLIPQGCDAGEFLRAPTVFFNHDYAQPVGRCTAIVRHADRLEAKTLFAQRPAEHEGPWLPDTLLALFQQGVIRGFSVGFIPIESRRPSRRDREQFGGSVVRVHSKWKLLEYSVCPLPANQDALALAVSKGVLTLAAAQQVAPQMPVRRRKLLLIPAGKRSLEEPVQRALLKARGQLYG